MHQTQNWRMNKHTHFLNPAAMDDLAPNDPLRLIGAHYSKTLERSRCDAVEREEGGDADFTDVSKAEEAASRLEEERMMTSVDAFHHIAQGGSEASHLDTYNPDSSMAATTAMRQPIAEFEWQKQKLLAKWEDEDKKMSQACVSEYEDPTSRMNLMAAEAMSRQRAIVLRNREATMKKLSEAFAAKQEAYVQQIRAKDDTARAEAMLRQRAQQLAEEGGPSEQQKLAQEQMKKWTALGMGNQRVGIHPYLESLSQCVMALDVDTRTYRELRNALAVVNGQMLRLTTEKAEREMAAKSSQAAYAAPPGSDGGDAAASGLSLLERRMVNVMGGKNMLDSRRYFIPSDEGTQKMLCLPKASGADENGDECKTQNSYLDKASRVFGAPVVEAFVQDTLENGSVVVNGVRVCYKGTTYPTANLRRPMGNTKKTPAGFCVERNNETSFVPRRQSNATGVLFAYAVVGGVEVGAEKAFGERAAKLCALHPGICTEHKVDGTVVKLSTADAMSAMKTNDLMLDPKNLSVTLVRFSPAVSMFKRDIRTSPSKDMFRRAASEATHALLIYVPQNTVYGSEFDRLVRAHTAKDNTLRFNAKTERMNTPGEAPPTNVEDMDNMSTGKFVHETNFAQMQNAQHTLAEQMASFFSRTDDSGIGLELAGTPAEPMGVVMTDGWVSIPTKGDSGSKTVYMSNVVPLNSGFGVVPVFSGPGNGFTIASSSIRTSGGRHNEVEDTKIVPASAARLKACNTSEFVINKSNQAWIEAQRKKLALQNVHIVKHNGHGTSLTRELLAAHAGQEGAYQPLDCVHDIIEQYAGHHASSPAPHCCSFLF